MAKSPEFLTDLKVKLKDMLSEIEGEIDSIPARDIQDKFKLVAYRLSIKRYLLIIELLEKIEERFNVAIEEIEEISDLINLYKSLLKGVDILNSQIRFLFPAKLPEDYVESIKEVDEINEENEAVAVRKILYKMIKETTKAIIKVRKDMERYDNQSVEYWKAVNTYSELVTKLESLIARLDKLNEAEASQEIEITMEEILEAYQEIEEIEMNELPKIEQKINDKAK